MTRLLLILAIVLQAQAAPTLPHVLIHTEAGDIEVEIDTAHAPITAGNFLKYVDAGFYTGGEFHRTVTKVPDNQPTNTIKIEVIQAAANEKRRSEFPPPIPLEQTDATGLRHLDGTISMARGGPDTARDGFFICIGDQPELDFGGKRNPDLRGFAAFGRVVRGMDVVRRIQTSPAEGQNLAPPITMLFVRRVTKIP
jgi:peptidyl-prolyl cis-trans isomerase A (cyclophilin A)